MGIFFCILFCFKLYIQPIKQIISEINNSGNNNINTINDSLKLINASYSLGDLPNVSYSVQYVDSSNDSNSISNMIHCQKYGLYLGSEDIPVDCTNICNSTGFGYKYITQPSFIVHTAITMRPGGYCLPNEITRCNQYTGLMLKTYESWTCQSRWPEILQGDDTSTIVGCNGYITDQLTGQTYIHHLPVNVVLNDIYTDKLPNGQFRFECTDILDKHPLSKQATLYDNMGNKLIPSPTSRFVRIKNHCASLIYSANPVIKPNFEQGYCECPEEMQHGLRYNHNTIDSQPCSSCFGGQTLITDDKSLLYMNFPRKCIKASDLINSNNISLDNSSFIDTLPCGIKKFNNTSSKCINGQCFPTNQSYSHFTKSILVN